jgi:hypothetical protein
MKSSDFKGKRRHHRSGQSLFRGQSIEQRRLVKATHFDKRVNELPLSVES